MECDGVSFSNSGYDNLAFNLHCDQTATSSRNSCGGKPDSTSSGDNSDRILQEKTVRRWSLYGASVAVIVIAAIVICVVLAVKHEQQGAATSVETDIPGLSTVPDFEGSFRLVRTKWDPAMADTNSDIFRTLGTEYKAMIERIFAVSNISNVIHQVTVVSLRNGSVIVQFYLHLIPVHAKDDRALETLHWALSQHPHLLISAFRQGLSKLLASKADVKHLSDVSAPSLHVYPYTQTTAAVSAMATNTSTTATSASVPTTSAASRMCGVVSRRSRVRIVGGATTRSGEFPWMVLILVNNTFVCGGSIMDPLHVISAAHCFEHVDFPGIVPMVTVVAGEIHMDPNKWSEHVQQVSVSRVFNHPDYNLPTQADGNSNINDITVLRLSRPLTLTRRVSTICMPRSDSPLPHRCTVAGWGSTAMVSKSESDQLRATTLHTYNSTACTATFAASLQDIANLNISHYVTDGVMCAANGLSGGRDACFGDSGGPLFCLQRDEFSSEQRYTQFGVVSWGEGCGLPGSPGFYTYLPHFVQWLYQVALPTLNFLTTVDGVVCLHGKRCVDKLTNVPNVSSTVSLCKLFASVVDCVVKAPLTKSCSRYKAQTEVRIYVRYLSMTSISSGTLDLTRCLLDHDSR